MKPALILILGVVSTVAYAQVLSVQTRQRFVEPGAELSFTIQTDNAPLERADLGRLKVSFPGLQQTTSPEWNQSGITVRGRLPKPGVYSFEVSLERSARPNSVRDYFVATSGPHAGAVPHGGYYVFLGRGDYWEPTHQLAVKPLADWEQYVEWMEKQQLDTLYVLLNGYTLAYPTEKYPELRDPLSQNAKYNFLGELIEFAHKHHVRVYLTLTTDDHARGFGEHHPETIRRDQYGYPRTTGALTLENPRVQQYIKDVFAEVLELYPHADGLVVHPSEADPDRFNPETLVQYRKETGADLTREPKEIRYRWYNRKFAEFLRELYRLSVAKNPHLEVIMFNCWWQDDYVALYKELIPAQMRICVWYYGWDDKDAVKWPIYKWTREFGARRIVYMPTGRSFLYPAFGWQEVERHIGTDRLISTADALGVRDVVYFTGWSMGTEEDRIRDLVLARFPSTSLAADGGKLDLVPRLYEDYLGARTALFH
jgi:hypothetical protein